MITFPWFEARLTKTQDKRLTRFEQRVFAPISGNLVGGGSDGLASVAYASASESAVSTIIVVAGIFLPGKRK
jgi:hypothetical protein